MLLLHKAVEINEQSRSEPPAALLLFTASAFQHCLVLHLRELRSVIRIKISPKQLRLINTSCFFQTREFGGVCFKHKPYPALLRSSGDRRICFQEFEQLSLCNLPSAFMFRGPNKLSSETPHKLQPVTSNIALKPSRF